MAQQYFSWSKCVFCPQRNPYITNLLFIKLHISFIFIKQQLIIHLFLRTSTAQENQKQS